jgi:glycosyltransferase involved in cell wall biosynthesis
VTPRHDVAIYAPYAARLYGRRPNDQVAGGAELQTTLLAHGLVERGLNVAHIVYPMEERYPVEPTTPTLIERAEHRGGLGGLRETAAIWRSLTRADASIVIVRGSGGHVVPSAAYCRARGRGLVFSASNDLDFDFDRTDRSGPVLRAYRRGVEGSDSLIVQTGQQRALAQAAFPMLDPLLIPSFCQPAEESGDDGRYFLWADRFVDYKRPEIFVELAERVPEAHFRMIAPTTAATDRVFAAALEERVARLPNFELLPGQQRPEVLKQIANCTALVKTSLVEGMPNTFLEAWARSVPVLSYAVDPDERIADNRAGIVAGGSTDRFAEGARQLWNDGALRAELGANGRRFVETTHSPAAVADRWNEVLQPLLAKRRG